MCIEKYPEYKNIYVDYEMKEVIQEKNNPIIYNESIYPYMKYFVINAHPKIKIIKNEIHKKKNQFPLLNSLFNADNYHSLDNLEKFNESINNIVNFFSYTKNITSRNLNKSKNKELLNLVKNFSEDKVLVNILESPIDKINDLILGKYKSFIKAQNNVIKIGINYDLPFKRLFRKINIQDALYNDILKFKLKSFDEYDSFHTLFYYIFYKNFFNLKKNVDYFHYKEFNFDLIKLEQEIFQNYF